MSFVVQTIGVLIMVAGVFLGVWLTVWWGWILGIVNLIEAARATPVVAMDVAISIVRIVFASLVGGLVGWVVVSVGVFIGSLATHTKLGKWK